MIPRVARSGRSFKGAAQYYLHDKKADTADRVAFIETLNLPTMNAQTAIAHMIDTATHAAELKQAAGIKAGRDLQKPVYVYSLAWHPNEVPTQAEQIAAARETIAALGLSNRQALIVSHNDTDHPHVHVIVNRVCPETGKAAVMSNDQLILSKWAEDYERRNGKIHCEARVQNNAERDQGQWKKHTAESRRAYREWQKATTVQLWQEYRAEKDGAKASRPPQFEALWNQRQNRMAARKAEIKMLFKPQWRDLFKKQRQDLAQFDTRLRPRLKFALEQAKGNKVIAALRAFTADQGQRAEFIKTQERAREHLGQVQMHMIRDAGREVTKAWKYDRDQLRAMHKAEDDKRLEHYRSQSETIWNEPKADRPANEQEKSRTPEVGHVRQTFAEKMRESEHAEKLAEQLKVAQEQERKERKRNRTRKRDNSGRTRTLD